MNEIADLDGVPAQAPTVDTVEALVRRQLATALGGRRGFLEAAVPGLVFTIVWLPTKDVVWAVGASGAIAGAALLLRLVQRSSTQYVWNAVFGVFLGWLFVRWAGSAGATPEEQGLYFYLPGILFSLGYTVVLGLSCLLRWPMMGFMLGVTDPEDPFGWQRNDQIRALCSRLTWLLLLPGAVGVLLQGPVWLAGHSGAIGTGTAVLTIFLLRTVLGWVLRIGAWSAMVWLVARNATPLEPDAA